MADNDILASRSGQINKAGDVTAIYLKVFAGEVLAAFSSTCVFADKHRQRQISSGKSAQFPAIGTAVASYHTPGKAIIGQSINHNEKIITIDDILLAPVYINDIDEAMSHYDVRGEYSKQLGVALAQTFDKNVARISLLNARTSATTYALNAQNMSAEGGAIFTAGVDARVNPDIIADAFFAAAQRFDEVNVPDADRYAFMRPASYYAAAAATALINKDWGGKGSIAEGKFETLAGIDAVKTNNLPQANEAALLTVNAKYRGDYSNTAMLFQHREAVGTVKLMDLSMQSEYLTQNQATLMVARYAVGHGGLRPEFSIEVKAA